MFLQRVAARQAPKQLATIQKRFMGHIEDPAEAASTPSSSNVTAKKNINAIDSP